MRILHSFPQSPLVQASRSILVQEPVTFHFSSTLDGGQAVVPIALGLGSGGIITGVVGATALSSLAPQLARPVSINWSERDHHWCANLHGPCYPLRFPNSGYYRQFSYLFLVMFPVRVP